MAPSLLILILVLVLTISLLLLINLTSILPCPYSQQTQSYILHRQAQVLVPINIISTAFDAIIVHNFIVKKKKKQCGHPSLPEEDEPTMWHWHLFNNELTPTRVANVHPSVHTSVHTSSLSNIGEIFVKHRSPRRFLVKNNALPTWPGTHANSLPYPHNTQKMAPSGGDTSSGTPSVPLPQFPTLGPPMVWSFPSPPNVIPPLRSHDRHHGHRMPLYPGVKNPYITTPPRTRKHSHYDHHIPTNITNAAEPAASPGIGEERAPQPVSGGPLPLP